MIVWIYHAALLLLAIYSLHRLYLTYLYLRPSKLDPPKPHSAYDNSGNWPFVSVQLPIFNEKFVVARLLQAVASFDYPRERFEIQVLDDSTDETSALIERETARLRQLGVSAMHIRRENRIGFKAGALSHGLTLSKGDLIAIFDADFVPPADFLKSLVPRFQDEKIGMVQARWGHLNFHDSILTQTQAMMLDGHFRIEQQARANAGLFFNFNGTAGIWRKEAIVSSGGWNHDTVTEDLDLSYRAQLKGWKFAYVSQVLCPAELPKEVAAFKTQQYRWAKGSAQTAFKIFPKVWRSKNSLGVKIESFFHLTSNVTYLFLAITALTFHDVATSNLFQVYPSLLGIHIFLWTISILALTTFFLASREQSSRITGVLARIPLLIALSIGMAINNAFAVMEGWFTRGGEFVRTPKEGFMRSKFYRPENTFSIWFETIATIYLTISTAELVMRHDWFAAAWSALFLGGYLYVALATFRNCFAFRKIIKAKSGMYSTNRGQSGSIQTLDSRYFGTTAYEVSMAMEK